MNTKIFWCIVILTLSRLATAEVVVVVDAQPPIHNEIVSIVSPLQFSLPSQEWDALYSIYTNTGGDNWKWPWDVMEKTHSKPWNFSIQNNGMYENPCSSQNPWEGLECTSSCESIPCHISALRLDSLDLIGEIPTQIQVFAYLHIFSVSHNHNLTSTNLQTLAMILKPDIFPILEVFNMGFCNQRGPIPKQLCDLHSLKLIQLFNNRLNGTLPNCLGALTNLTQLVLSANRIGGTIPISFQSLINLQYLALGSNSLHGTLPPQLSQLHDLNTFIAGINFFTSTIPESYYHGWPNLKYLELFRTHISGTISNNISYWSNLSIAGLFEMQLTGSLPNSLGQLTNLTQFFIYGNNITGTLPASLGNLHRLQSFCGAFNSMHGTIPSELFTAGHSLEILYLNDNLFTGFIPSNIGDLDHLQVLNIGGNFLSGELPDSICNGDLSDFSVNYNFLHGTLPNCIGNLNHIKSFDVSENSFSGMLPSFVSTKLRELMVNNNLFGGPAAEAFNVASLTDLSSIDLSYNFFTGAIPSFSGGRLQAYYVNNNGFVGTLPSAIFQHSPLLTIFVASINCLDGTLPLTICDSTLLSTIELDGLSSSKMCKHKASFLSNSFPLESVHGTIPECLFTLPQLSIVSLSGNQFTGSIGDVSTTSRSFTQLQLASNDLQGQIPAFIWKGNFTKIDLSFNRLNGSIDSRFSPPPDATVYVQRNQLSGNIPNALWNLKTVNVLEGNIFSCRRNRNDLPHHDPLYETYSCGSDSLNDAIYVWLTLTVVVCFVGWALVYRVRSKLQHIRTMLEKWWNLATNTNSKAVPFWLRLLICNFLVGSNMRQYLIRFALLLLFAVAIYAGISSDFGCYTHQYGWIITATYTRGLISTLMLLTMYIVMTYYLVEMLRVTISARSTAEAVKRSIVRKPIPRVRRTKAKRRLESIFLLLVDATVVLAINVTYVLSLSKPFSFMAHQVISILLSAFKILCSMIVVNNFGIYFNEQIVIAINIFNNIVAPYLAEMLASPDCFWYILNSPPSLQSSVDNVKCKTFSICFIESCRDIVECHNTAISIYRTHLIQLSYTPPFKYSYMCSSSLLSTFSAVFIFRYIYSGIIVPVWIIVAKLLQQRWGIVVSPAVRLGWKARFMSTIPVLLRPIWLNEHTTNLIDIDYGSATKSQLDRSRRSFIVPLITDAAVLVSMGLTVPPLGLLICLSMINHTIMFILSIGRTLDMEANIGNAHVQNNLRIVLEKLSHVYRTWSVSFKFGTQMVIIVAQVTWGFLLFDTLGYQYGMKKALWAPCLTNVLPIFMFYGTSLWSRIYSSLFIVNAEKLPIITLEEKEDSVTNLELLSVPEQVRPNN